MRRVRLAFSCAVICSPLFGGCTQHADTPPKSDPAAECVARVREIHGAAGPWAVTGYRMGQRALLELGLPTQSFSVLVIQRAPAEVQYSCIADGLQAATGASLGKLNLRLEEAPLDQLSSVVEDRQLGRRLTFTLQPAFVRSIKDIPRNRLEAEGARVAALPDAEIFQFSETTATNPHTSRSGSK